MPLSDPERRVVRLFSAIVRGDFEALAAVRSEAADGEPDAAWREAVYMSHLFAGIPRQVEAYEVLDRCGGLGEGEPDPRPEEVRAAVGAALFARIYGERHEAVGGRLSSFHPDLDLVVRAHAYGRVLSREGLTPRQRELLAVAALTLLGPDRQLASHVRGAVRCGAARAEVFEVIDLVARDGDPERIARARAVAEKFADAT